VLPLVVLEVLMVRMKYELIGNEVMSLMFKGSDYSKELLVICRILSP